MNFHIFTVYNSRNFGSYLQATALLETLKKYGDANFVNTNSRDTKTHKAKELTNNLLHCKLNRAVFENKSSNLFLTKQEQLPVVQAENISDDDICVFGSDEIWNVARRSFSDYPIFWGKGLELNPKFSYAPSINYTTSQQLTEYGAKNYLEQFDSVSVRDDYSKQTLESVCRINVQKVVDPTMLFTKDYYLSNYRKYDLPYKNYIAVYSYFRNSDEQVAQIRALAKKMGKKLVSVGLYNSWCDYCVIAPDLNPFVYYEGADFVISNTFHGIAFAITFKKNFIAVLNNNSNKVQSMLDDFSLNSRISDGKSLEQMIQIYNTPIDYTSVNALLEQHRNESFKFIENAINTINSEGER